MKESSSSEYENIVEVHRVVEKSNFSTAHYFPNNAIILKGEFFPRVLTRSPLLLLSLLEKGLYRLPKCFTSEHSVQARMGDIVLGSMSLEQTPTCSSSIAAPVYLKRTPNYNIIIISYIDKNLRSLRVSKRRTSLAGNCRLLLVCQQAGRVNQIHKHSDCLFVSAASPVNASRRELVKRKTKHTHTHTSG